MIVREEKRRKEEKEKKRKKRRKEKKKQRQEKRRESVTPLGWKDGGRPHIPVCSVMLAMQGPGSLLELCSM